MARLIDADKLLEALGIFKDYEHGNPHFMNGIETNRELVIGAPTIDAEPVRHGRWIEHKDEHQCSECREFTIVDFYVWKNMPFDYCPWCGAKMDGGNNDGKAY